MLTRVVQPSSPWSPHSLAQRLAVGFDHAAANPKPRLSCIDVVYSFGLIDEVGHRDVDGLLLADPVPSSAPRAQRLKDLASRVPTVSGAAASSSRGSQSTGCRR